MNKIMRTTILILVLWSTLSLSYGQGVFSGGFQSNANFFLRDSVIGAANIPQYDYQLFGAEAWLDLNYTIDGYSAGVRFDLFNNSNLLDPNDSYSAQGIGRWYIRKELEKLDIQVGHIYNQIGSGIIYRAFEERPQLIDNALLGAELRYNFTNDWNITAFTGKQRNLFGTFASVIKGGKVEGFLSLGEESPVSLAPGFGVVNRTLDDESMNRVISIIKNYIPDEAIVPEYNTYLASFYNTLSYKSFTWYLEAAYKTQDAFRDPNAIKTEITGATSFGRFLRESGSVLYTSVSYAKNKLGITLEAKRTENFNFRTDPTLIRNFGQVNFLPPMNRQNTYRLTTRYSPAVQDLSELAFQADIKYRIKKNLSVLLNVSNVTTLVADLLYRELYTEIQYKYKRLWQIRTGLQIQNYNQEVYEVKPNAPIVETITPYLDFLYKINRKKSIRTELQYMLIGDDEKANAKQDYGDWLFGQVEFNIPHWSFVVSDMYNFNPGKNSPTDDNGEKLAIHYPRVDVFYTHKSNRYGLSYVKQVEGVVCTGGICRLEPAFSGFKFSVNSTF